MTSNFNCAVIFSSSKIKINTKDFDYIFTDDADLVGNNVIYLKSLVSKK